MEPGIKKLTEAVKRDCREGQGCFNPNGCDHEFIRHVPETDPFMIRLGQKTKCIKVSKCAHKYCDKYKWILDRAEEYAEALGVTRDDVLNGWEKYRSYWYMNYYQGLKQPSLKGDQKVIKFADWLKELRSRFGEDDEDWKFVCPSCGHVQSVADFKAIGVDGNKAYYECISRYKNIDGKTNKKPCKYTLCGLFVLDHDTVINNEFLPVNVFKMADVPGESKHTDRYTMQKYVLKLVVKKKWFDMIVSGEKTEEYREIKPYWIDKLVNQDADSGFIGYANEEKKQPKVFGEIEYIPFTHVLFFHGYSKNRKSIEKEIDSITIGKPQKGMCPDEWLDTDVFIIRFK